MARFSAGMRTESFSSTRDRLSSAAAAVGLGSILRDHKTWPGTSRANVLLGQIANPPDACSLSKSPARSLASSPVESVSLSESDDADSLKEEDIWALEAAISRPTSTSPSLDIKQHQLGLSYDVPDLCSEAQEPPPYHDSAGLRGHTVTSPSQATFSHIHSSQLQGRHSRSSTSSGRHRVEIKGAGLAHATAAESSGTYASSVLPVLKVSDSAVAAAPVLHIPPVRSVTIPQAQRHESARRPLHVEHQSAPVDVPDWAKIRHRDENGVRNRAIYPMQESDLEEVDHAGHGKMVPPHVFLAREYARRKMMTSSVCEGHGRTLKGRDMSRVRNAVWSRTGFAD